MNEFIWKQYLVINIITQAWTEKTYLVNFNVKQLIQANNVDIHEKCRNHCL